MSNKFLGGIMLVVGTSIGGGMLALPIATAQLGFIMTLCLLIVCWAVMMSSALLVLEVNLWHPTNSNLISMARSTLGLFGQIVAWASYLLLLYALLAAYIAGGGNFLQHFLAGFRIKLSSMASGVLFSGILSAVIYRGIRSADYINRGLMFGKLAAIVFLIVCIFPNVSIDYLLTSEKCHSLSVMVTSITVIITSFGFAVIVPSLRSYFQGNVRILRKVILLGSLIPLVCYVLWELVILGVMPLTGKFSLVAMACQKHEGGDLISILNHLLHKPLIDLMAKVFTVICLATSFLGVALSLSDFLRDGLAVKKTRLHGLLVYALTFLPPLVISSYYPNVFITALSYAGILCIILLVLLPAMMAWSGRYGKRSASAEMYQVTGGKYLLGGLLVASVLLIPLSLFH